MNVSDNSNNTTGYEGGGNAIEYDQNGNMLNMEDKRINQIGYNYHHLPNALIIENNNKKLFYTYRADGIKLRKIFTFSKKEGGVFTTVTDYLDGFHYLTTLGSRPTESDPIKYAYEQEAYLEEVLEERPLPRLQFYPTAEGFYDFEKNEYIYQYKDHLGNVRVSYKRGPTGQLEITDKNSYYPFGMNILREEKAIFGTASMYNYKYNDKELQETGMYDYGARFYMPDIGRWGVVDPLSETSRRWSVYTYAYNNPIRFIDPDGRSGKDWYENNLTKNIEWHDGSDERKGETNLTQKAEGKQIAIIEQDNSGNVVNTNMLNSDGSITRNGETVTNGYSVTTVADRTITSRQPWEAVLNADGGEPGQGGNPGFRFPDYYTANVSIAIPNPLTASFVGWNGTLTVDRNFTVYASPIGVSAGKSAGLFSGSLTANWLNQLKTPTGSQLNNFLSGHGISFGGGNIVGGGVSYSSGNGTATSLGLYTPQLGVSYNYTPDELIFNK